MHSTNQMKAATKCLFGLFIAASTGCGNSDDASTSKQVLPPPVPAVQIMPSKTTTPPKPNQDAFGVPVNFHPAYILKEDENVSLGKQYTRRQIRIVVPAGLSDAEVENNMRAATERAYQKDAHPHAILVFAYKPGTNIHRQYTAGRLQWAPGGDWVRANEDVSVEEHQVATDIYEDYRPKPQPEPEDDSSSGLKELDAMAAEANAEQDVRIKKTDRHISESKRRRIYYAYQGSVHRIMDTRYEGDRMDSALKENDASLRAKYHITSDELDSIRVEGDGQGWQQPQ